MTEWPLSPAEQRLARLLWLIQLTTEFGLYGLLTAMVLAFGAVHPWAYEGAAVGVLVLTLLLGSRAVLAGALRGRVGPTRIVREAGLWRTVEGGSTSGRSQTFHLGRGLLTAGPLVGPGLVLGCLVALQLFVPASLAGGGPAGPWSVAPDATTRGLGFLAGAIVLHVVASTLFTVASARRRFRYVLPVAGLAVSLLALAFQASGTRRVFGLFAPEEGTGLLIMGPFVNHNHFATCMLMVFPFAAALAVDAFQRCRAVASDRARLRSVAAVLARPEGATLLYRALPALGTASALVAANSRGGLLAFIGSLLLAGAARARRAGVAMALSLALVSVGLALFGTQRISERFARSGESAETRFAIWKHTVDNMQPRYWLGGCGYNAWPYAFTRVVAWGLPEGATPWTDEERALSSGKVGHLLMDGWWYREAHNDYLQLVSETGLPGFVIAVWAIAALLVAARRDPWLLAALLGPLLHATVDFSLQIPAISALFVSVAGLSSAGRDVGRISRGSVRTASPER